MQDEELEVRNSKLDSFKGFIRTFFWLAREEWTELDHKVVRIAFGVVGFVVMALFWLYFLRNITPV